MGQSETNRSPKVSFESAALGPVYEATVHKLPTAEMRATGQRVIVLLGMHRSGTSPITRGLKALGVELGEDLLPSAPENPTGFWEDAAVYELNERLLASIGRVWHSVAPIRSEMWNVPEMQAMKRAAVETVRTRFGKFPLWGFKDPRTARLLPFWQDIFKHLGIAESYVLIIRNPISVARSLKVRNQFAFEKSYLLWLEHSVEAYTHTCGMPRVVVDYDALMAHPGEQLRRIAEKLALPLDPAVEDSIRDYAHGFLDNRLRHSAFEPTDVYRDTHAPDLVANTYDMLRQVASDQLDADSKEVQSALSSARSGLGGFAPFFSYSDLLEAERDSIRRELEEVRDKSIQLTGQVAHLREAMVGIEAERKSALSERVRQNTEFAEALRLAQSARDDAHSALGTAESQLSERDRQNAELADKIRRADDELERTREELRWTLEKLEAVKAENQVLGAATESLRASEESLRSENEAFKPRRQLQVEANAILRSELDNLWNSWSWRLFRPLRNLVCKLQGLGKETEPILHSELEAIQTVITIRQSLSWELTAPLRLIYRMLPRRRRIRAANLAANILGPDLVESGSTLDSQSAAAARSAQDHSDAKEKARQVFAARLSDFLGGDNVISLPRSERPDVSIILVLYNQAALTFGCLSSIIECLGNSSVGVDIIIADNGSTDRTEELLRKVVGATVLWNETNLGFLKAVNQAAAQAGGRYILLLNNDAQLLPGSLEAATRVLDASPDVGAVGGRLILPDGTLQEGGSIVWRDGSTSGYGRGDQPTSPAYMFRRDVDYCSGAFLLTRRELFGQLGGFDEAFVPAYYEEADYCMRLWESGYRVVYEPEAVVLHYEFGSSEKVGSALELQRAHREVFARKHAEKLQSHLVLSQSNLLAARSAGTKRKRILMIEDEVPHTQLGRGLPRSRRILTELVAGDAFVTFFPVVSEADEWSAVWATVPPEVEVMVGYGIGKLERLLEERRGFYGAILICRPHNMRAFLDVARRRPELIEGATVIYDAEAFFALRDILKRRLRDESHDQMSDEAMIVEEASLARAAKLVLSVSAREAAEFRRRGVDNVELLGNILEPTPGKTSFADRRGLLFVGRLEEEDSPNVDGLAWFARDVLPLVQKALNQKVRLMVAGANGAPSVSGLNDSSLTMLGQVKDLSPVYNTSRVFIAPIRFAAGIPLKIHEAAAHGVPVVVTPLLAEQLGWRDEEDLLVAVDTGGFAAQSARLYQDEALWTRLRMNALDRVRDDCAPDRFRKTIVRIIDATRTRDSEVIVPPASSIVLVKSDFEKHDFHLIKQDPDFDLEFFLRPSAPRLSRDEAIENFMNDWTADSGRKPYSGFNPQTYAEQGMSRQELEKRNPLAHFIEKGKPPGPWLIPLITAPARTPGATKLRTAMHVHAYYPEFMEELLRCIAGNASSCDLFVTTSRMEDLERLKRSLSSYNRGKVRISIVPNRGRDIGPFLTEYDWFDGKYDLLGHLHCKKTPQVDAEFGHTWRRFLWRNLIGEGCPMMDVIAKCFEGDPDMGLVFPDDPNIFGWMTNKEYAAKLAKKMGLTVDLPRAFDFPVGTMFWCRPVALRPLFELGLTWDQYPLEPLPGDGTILHAVERLLPFIARNERYRVAATNVGGLAR